MKKINVALALLLIVTFVIGCTAQQPAAVETESAAAPETETVSEPTAEQVAEPTSVPETSEPEEIKLKFFHPSLGPNADTYWQEIVESFNSSNENGISVELSVVDEETYKTKLDITLRSDDAPDVFYQWAGGKMAATVNNGYAEALDTYYDEYKWGDNLSQGAISTSSLNGKKYLACYNMTVYTFFYNKKVFEDNGVSVPQTWEELMAAADKLKAAGIYPFAMGNKSRWEGQFLWSNLLVHKYGIDVWNQLVNNEIPWTDERVVDAFTMTKDLIDKEYFYPGVNAIDYAETGVPLNNGEAAMLMYMGSFAKKIFVETEANIGVFTWPTMNEEVGQIPQVFCEGAVMINANGANKDAAAQFVDYILSPESQTKFMEAGAGVATNMNADFSVLSTLIQQQLDVANSVGTEVSFMPVDIQFDPAISTEFLDELQGVIGGMTAPEDAASAVEAAAVEVRGEVAQ